MKASYYTTVIYLKVGTIMYIDNNVKNVLSDIEAQEQKGVSLDFCSPTSALYYTHSVARKKSELNFDKPKLLLVKITYLEKL